MRFNYRSKYNYLLIGAGCIFLFNGNINILDVLPDFIGYILIAAGIGQLCLLNERFNNAKKASHYLIFVTLAKFIVSFFTGGFQDEDILLVTGVFIAVEFILAYRLFNNLFKANEMYFELNDSAGDARDSSLYGLFMKIFLFLKYFTSILAEMTVMIKPDFLDRIAFNYNILIDQSELRRAAVLIGVIVVSLFGVFMLTVIPSHFHRLYKNEQVNDKLRVMILSAVNKDLKGKLSKYSVIFFLLYISVIFLFDLNLDGIEAIPDVLSAAVILAVLINLKEAISGNLYKKALTAVSILLFLTASSCALDLFTAATELERAFSNGNDTALNIAAIALAVASNSIFAAVYIFIYTLTDKLRITEMNLAKVSKGLYVPKKEFERKINPSAVKVFIISAFAVKSFHLLNITNSLMLMIYLFICIFYVIFSIYKLDKARTSIKYYYQAN